MRISNFKLNFTIAYIKQTFGFRHEILECKNNVKLSNLKSLDTVLSVFGTFCTQYFWIFEFVPVYYPLTLRPYTIALYFILYCTPFCLLLTLFLAMFFLQFF